MKLLIIQPSHYKSKSNLSLHKASRRRVVNLTLPYLAALTPEGWDVILLDEQLTEIDFGCSVDLVAITTWTINSLRAYEIADRFRKRGVPVIMGGPHTAFYWEEAALHCDAVGIGEGESIWVRMLEDASRGRLKKIYRANGLHSLKGLPFPRYDLLDFRSYALFKTFSVQSSRGCPFRCEFCSERFYLGEEYRFRPVEEVIEEIKYCKAKNVYFADSMFAGKINHTMELMEALIPLRIRWSSAWSAYLCLNKEFMDLAKKSGLLHVNIGFESLDQDILDGMNKKANRANQYKEILDSLKNRGISYSLNFIFGWDTEKSDIYDFTLKFLKRYKVPVAYFNILTPHKGTPLYERMKADGRLIDEDNIGRWPGVICYYKPKNCSPEALEERIKRIHRDFYSLPSIISRLPLPITKANIASWIVNFSQRKMFTSAGDGEMENFDCY